MENLQDWVFPVVAIILWLVSKFAGGSLGESQGDGPSSEQEDVDAERRRIQEEIRRRVEARRQQQEQGASPPPIPGEPAAPPPIPRQQPQHFDSIEPQRVEVPPPQRNVAAELEAQRQELANAKRRAREAMQLAKAQIKKSASRKRKPVSATPLRRGMTVTEMLSSPSSVRNAYVLREVLDKPVCLRDNHLG